MNEAPRRPLAPGAVRVAWVPVDASGADPERARSLLSDDERWRADAYAAEGDRLAFARHRAALRAALATHLGTAPAAVRFGRGPHGRPQVVAPDAGGLRFSTARRGAWALIAVARDLDVGVDVEPLRRDLPLTDLAARVLDDAARAEVAAAADPVRAFFDAWTRLEAGLKALGVGLAEAERRRAAGDPVAPPPFVRHLDAGPDASAALAAGGEPVSVVVERG